VNGPIRASPPSSWTSRPLVDPPPSSKRGRADLAALADELERRGCRRVGIEGGGQLIRGMIDIGKLDVLEMAIIPLVLGEGIPLFRRARRS